MRTSIFHVLPAACAAVVTVGLAQTRLLEDIHPTASSQPAEFASFFTEALFVADDGPHGTELWATDGTTAGSIGSGIGNLARVGKRFAYFRADDGTHGREPWAVVHGASSRRCGAGFAAPQRQSPELDSGDPVLGQSRTVDGSPSGESFALLIAGRASRLPTVLHPGALVHTDLAGGWFPLAAVPLRFNYTLSVPIPAAPLLGGLCQVLQTWALGTTSATGFDLSNAVHWTLGK